MLEVGRRRRWKSQLPVNTQHNNRKKLTSFVFLFMLILVSLLFKKEEISYDCVNCSRESTDNLAIMSGQPTCYASAECTPISRKSFYLHGILRKPVYRRVNLASRNALQVYKEAKNRDQNRVQVYGEVLNIIPWTVRAFRGLSETV